MTIDFKLESKQIYLIEFLVKESPDLSSDPPDCSMVKLMGHQSPTSLNLISLMMAIPMIICPTDQMIPD